MPEYQYTSKDITGKKFYGVIEADNLDLFYKALHDQNQFCLSCKMAGKSSLNIEIGSKKVKLKDLSIFARQFSTMLEAGLPVIKCLDILYEQTQNKRFKAIILNIYEAVQRGDALSRAMKAQKNAFPVLFLNMVESGEASGSLESVMKRLADQLEKDNKLQNKVRQALIYPSFLVCMTIMVVIVLLVFVMPTFLSMFNQLGGKLPLTTRILLGFSHAITNYWYVILAVIALIAILWNMFLGSNSGRLMWDRFKLRVPVVGKILLTVESSRFARTLASLFSSGMPIIQAIEIVAKVIRNAYVQKGLYAADEDIRRGMSVSDAVKRADIFPIMLCSMISIGEESGNMDEILNKTSAFYDEESDAAINRLIALLEPAMIVVLAFVVGFIVISVITPVFSIYQNVNSYGS